MVYYSAQFLKVNFKEFQLLTVVPCCQNNGFYADTNLISSVS